LPIIRLRQYRSLASHFKMKYTFALLTLVAVASAQSLPACAQPCINAAVQSSTTCSLTDIACQCQTANMNAIQSAATSCVIQKCSSADAAGMLSLCIIHFDVY
jgi:hypothetical protein